MSIAGFETVMLSLPKCRIRPIPKSDSNSHMECDRPPAAAHLPMSLLDPDLGPEETLLLVRTVTHSSMTIVPKPQAAPSTAESHFATQVHLACARCTSCRNMTPVFNDLAADSW